MRPHEASRRSRRCHRRGTLLAAPALAQTALPPAISVTGEATVSVPPDLAQIDAGVTSDAKTAREASEANNAAMGKVLLALKGAGIDEKDYPDLAAVAAAAIARRTGRGPPAIVGYRASNRVTVRLRDVAKVASVIDMLVGAGANDIGGINFMVSQASKLLDDARETGGRRRPPQGRDLRQGRRRHARRAAQHFRRRRAACRCSAPRWRAPWPRAAPVAQGEETLSVTVSVSWAIKPAQ